MILIPDVRQEHSVPAENLKQQTVAVHPVHIPSAVLVRNANEIGHIIHDPPLLLLESNMYGGKAISRRSSGLSCRESSMDRPHDAVQFMWR